MLKYLSAIIIFAVALSLNSCSKKVDDFSTASINDYYPLQVGKYITYNLDSTIFINFGQREAVVSYQVQDRVDAQITDNNDSPAYRIIRYIRKDETQDWQPDNTFMAVPTNNSLEFVENNLRFIKLKLPVTEGFSWLGNSYLSPEPYPSYEFASFFMEDWEYIYQQVNTPINIGTINFDSTITVFERNDSIGDPKIVQTEYAEKTYSIEKYQKNVGLIYKEFLHWEYQGNSNSYIGFGVKLSIIDHN